MTDTLTALDATFLELEQLDDGALMHIGGVMVFDALPDGRTPTVQELCANLAPRIASLPRYSQRLSAQRTGGLAWPQWVPDERFDLRAHIGHIVLPAPGGEAELCTWAARFYSHRLDRTRPLWEMVLIEGLEEGRWAIAHKTHHCMVDGVGSVDVASVLLDPAPDAAPVVAAPLPAVVPESPAPSLPRGAQTIAQALHVGATVAQAGLYAALHPQEALERSRSLADVIIRDELIPASASSINVPIGSTRRFAVVTVPFAEVSAIRGALGGSVNDVVLAACTTGLRRLLIGRDEPLPDRGLRAMVPINLRDASERLALGNRISSLFVGLPVAGEDGRGRYDSIVAETTRLKASGAGVGASTIIDIAGLAPPVLHATLARSLYSTRLFNITITNVPGSPQPLYSLGARMRAVYPLVPIAADHTLGIAVFSYDGALTFGVTADADSTPDLSELTSGIRAGIAELLALASRRASASGRSRRAGERAPV